MKKLMLELLTYEPFGKFLPEEKEYICAILSGNYDPPQPLAKFHELFLGFYDYYVQNIQNGQNGQNGNSKNISWLRRWKNKYIKNKNYMHSTKSERVYYPLLLKKICFYIMIRDELTDKEFMGILGLSVNRIRKWGISTKFRRYAEANTYSVIRTFRAGVKKPYIVSLVKKLYYEAGRQVSHSMILKKLPTFVDVFAGTASVAASVVTDGCPPPIVNDYDPVMVCFAWAFTYYQREIRKEIVEFHDYLRRGLKLTDCSYNVADYERHKDEGNVFTDPEASDNPSPRTQWLWETYGYSKEYISFLSELQVKGLNAVTKADEAERADKLLKFPLKANSLTLDSTRSFSRHLKGAKFYCEKSEDILKLGSDKIYYLDSPYFLTTEYDVKFSDDDHKKMLDALRDEKFKWIFSMQYNPSSRYRRTGGRSRRNQPHIKDYGAYYQGFLRSV